MNRHFPRLATALLTVFVTAGCTTYTTRVDNVPPGRATRYVPTDTPTRMGTTGIESQDIVAMTDQMVGDMLASPALVNTVGKAATVIVDDKFFRNESSQRLNKKLIVDRLRIELLRSAKGRIRFIARHASDMFEHEQDLRETGVVGGTAKKEGAHAQLFRLTGNFQNLTDRIAQGETSNYVQVVFEMVDMDTKEIVWGGMYEFKKTSRESLFYQ